MGRYLHWSDWVSLTWRSAAADQVTTVKRDYLGLWPNSRELTAMMRERHQWCETDECCGDWNSASYTIRKWNDEEQEDETLGSRLVFHFTNPVSALAFKLRWC